MGFNDRSDKYYIHFINTSEKKPIDVVSQATFVDTTTLEVLSPNFDAYGTLAKECVVRIAINDNDYSVTNTNFL